MAYSYPLEAEIRYFDLFYLFHFRFLYPFMYLVCLDNDGSHRAYGADRLASSAPYAQVGIHFRNGQRPLVGHHPHGLRGAMLRACAAIVIFGIDDAPLDEEMRHAYLRRGLLLFGDGLEGVCRTDIGTYRTFVVAIAVLVGHVGLQEVIEPVLHPGGTEHLARALRHADVASRAEVLEPFDAERAGRRHGWPMGRVLPFP